MPEENSEIILDSPTVLPSYAGFWRRVAACLIDLCIAVPILLLGQFIAQTMIPGGEDSPAGGWFVCATFFSLVLAKVLFESSKFQATPGKMLLGIVVTNKQGERQSFFRALGRVCAMTFSQALCGYGYIMSGMTMRKQTLHDICSGSLVMCKAKADSK